MDCGLCESQVSFFVMLLMENLTLKFILAQCALDASVIFGKTGSPSHNFFVVKNLFKNVTLKILNFILVS